MSNAPFLSWIGVYIQFELSAKGVFLLGVWARHDTALCRIIGDRDESLLLVEMYFFLLHSSSSIPNHISLSLALSRSLSLSLLPILFRRRWEGRERRQSAGHILSLLLFIRPSLVYLWR